MLPVILPNIPGCAGGGRCGRLEAPAGSAGCHGLGRVTAAAGSGTTGLGAGCSTTAASSGVPDDDG